MNSNPSFPHVESIMVQAEIMAVNAKKLHDNAKAMHIEDMQLEDNLLGLKIDIKNQASALIESVGEAITNFIETQHAAIDHQLNCIKARREYLTAQSVADPMQIVKAA